MTKEQEEGNEIIARYDSWKFVNQQWEYEDTEEWCCMKTIKEAKFHSDWNWLIPVVKKVLLQLEKRESVWNVYKGFIAIENIRETLLTLEIESLWQEVVNAIQLINTQSNTDTKQ